mmetsp:Transcript_13762/g.44877  ORF Transcript_13762/g.44877 Transcript_13762/m.44877 type:complete len:207 (+) Transcript_13762:2127-2747(+)
MERPGRRRKRKEARPVRGLFVQGSGAEGEHQTHTQLDKGEHVGGEGEFEVAVGGVVGRFGDLDGLADAVVEEHGEAFAAPGAEDGRGPRVRELDVEGLGEGGRRVGDEGDDGAVDLLVLGPGAHDRRVVDAVDQDRVDPLSSQRLFRCDVPGDLLRRSRRRERPRQADEDHFFSGDELGKRHALQGELRDHRHTRSLVPDLHFVVL